MDKFLTNYKGKSGGDVECIKSIPWTEKYRPKTIDDISAQDEVINVLKKCINGSDFPNLLFYGPPGTGKTSTILAAAHELFNKHFSNRVLELNASDERGIAVIREKVKTFSKCAISTEGSAKSLPTFKLVILDECDNMTKSAQAALRRTMEVESKTTRFCLICNYVTKIISPIVSRCAKFRFKPLDNDVAVARLSTITKLENMQLSESTLLRLVVLAEGDLRRAITMMQSASYIIGKENCAIGEEFFDEVAGEIPHEKVKEFAKLVTKTSNFEKMVPLVKEVIANGYAAMQMIHQLLEFILKDESVIDDKKIKIIEILADAEEKLMGGTDEYLQLMSISASIVKLHG